MSEETTEIKLDNTQVLPLSRDRIENILKAREFSYFIDSDGDLGGFWGDNTFWLTVRGDKQQIYHIQSKWHGSLPVEYLEQVRQFIADWHTKRFWPKAFHSIDDNGRIRVFCEIAQHYQFGATDAQLDQQMHCAITTSIDFFSTFEKALELP